MSLSCRVYGVDRVLPTRELQVTVQYMVCSTRAATHNALVLACGSAEREHEKKEKQLWIHQSQFLFGRASDTTKTLSSVGRHPSHPLHCCLSLRACSLLICGAVILQESYDGSLGYR